MKRILFIAATILLAGQILTGCASKNSDTVAPRTKFMLVHASAKSPALDYYISNDGYNYSTIGTSKTYQSTTGYLDISSGNYAVIADTTSQLDNAFLTGQFVSLGGGIGNSLFVVDSSAAITRSILIGEDLTKAGADSAGIRFFHFAPGAPKLDVFISSSTTPDFSNRDFLYKQSNDANVASTRFSRILKGNYNVHIRATGTTDDLFNLPVTLDGTKLYTLFASGFAGETGERAFSAKLIANE